jgi:flagellar motility protein MotE (MotC chaperone)
MPHSGSLRPWWKVRLLPIVIISISALLVVRVGALSFGVELSPTSSALAAEEKVEDKTEDAGHEAKSPKEPKHEASTSTGDEAHDAPVDERPLIDYPVEFTPGEVAVLQNLAKRRDELVVLEKGLEARERLLNVTEERLDNRIAELQLLRNSIEALVREYDEQEESELQSIVKIYETMKPKDAASILGELDMQILLGIMEAMKERKSASILAAMEPERAREVTTELARKRVIDLSTPATKVETAG